MSLGVYRIFRVVALCALFSLHSALIGIVAAGMLGHEAGALQFSMDIIVLFTILCFSVLKYKRHNPSRILNLIAFSTIFVLSLVGAIGLAARGASGKGKGLCEDLVPNHPESCAVAAFAIAFTWISVMIAGAGLVASWLDRSSRIPSSSVPYYWKESEKELELPKQLKSGFHSSRSYAQGPTPSYIPRPRDPYDRPRRKHSTRSQTHQTNPQQVASNKAPVTPLPPLPSFNPLDLETDSVAARRINRRQKDRSRSERRTRKDLPELPPPTRRPSKDPHTMETRKMRHISPTDLFAQMGG